MLATKLLSAMAGGSETLYVDDVFSAYTYTGNGSAQTITNGIDLAGKGGMVWSKSRSSVGAGELRDSARGTAILQPSTTSAQIAAASDVTAFNSNGYNLGFVSGTANQGSTTFVAWTFRKAPKFFDVVTYTGTGTAGLTVSHSLGIKPGMIIVKRTDTTGNWAIYHQSIAAANGLQLESTSASFASSYWNSTEPTTTQFTLGAPATAVNASGGTYVAYLFAHDTATDGIVQCGSIALDGSGKGSASLGWEAQYILTKNISAAEDWRVFDSSRGFTVDGSTDAALYPNLTSAEYGGNAPVYPTATGFGINGFAASNTYIYLAIRRSNKPPTVGTQVYNAIASSAATGTALDVGFSPDMQIIGYRPGVALAMMTVDRLRGVSTTSTAATKYLSTASTAAEVTGGANYMSLNWGMTGFQMPAYVQLGSNVFWNFKRAVGVFDQVCYTGTGVAKTEAHGLGVVPELMIVRSRNYTGNNDWFVYAQSEGATKYLILQTTAATATNTYAWNNTSPTASVFTLGGGANQNVSGYTGVAYLFATKAGIQKITSFVGNGTSQTINCGFTTGARFVCIKATSATGDWLIGDSTRGLVAGNDPRLSLNTTAAEVTTEDWLDPDTSGFIVNQVAGSNANVNGVTYLVWAIA